MKWISVKDKLPEQNFLRVLVIDMSGDIVPSSTIEVVVWTESGWEDSHFTYIEPTHWCYLTDIPQPPKD